MPMALTSQEHSVKLGHRILKAPGTNGDVVNYCTQILRLRFSAQLLTKCRVISCWKTTENTLLMRYDTLLSQSTEITASN